MFDTEIQQHKGQYQAVYYYMNTLRLGTDFSGIEAPIQALKSLGIPFEHKFSCEINSTTCGCLLFNYDPKILFHDITKRDNSTIASQKKLSFHESPSQGAC
eukprot:TRINITY_DN11094_c0_g1_i1.p1 TRINITY_DN11094_c0_g1~~TRINITY_DN11094_c0_g1_i1.p1  ORF type:complete len:101 (+),score=0.81 TRINITY_DN11094_c0_g1_i1:229-531(+)